MTPRIRRFGITLALLGFASILPASVGAQPPAYLTQWGSPGGGDGQFYVPTAAATDAAGNVYVADRGNGRIQKFTSTGTYLTQWGSFGVGNGQFRSPQGVATDAAGNVYVADVVHIEKFTDTGMYVTQWGSYGTGNGQFDNAYGVATDRDGNVYVGDSGNSRIQKFTSTGIYLAQWGSYGSGDGEFNNPYMPVATDVAGDVYVSDFYNNRIQKFTSTGTYLTQWGSLGRGDGAFIIPQGVATDAAGNVYVGDLGNNRIQKFTGTGSYLTQWGSSGTGDGQFVQAVGVATDAAGNVYVVDSESSVCRIQKFGPVLVTPALLSLVSAEADDHGVRLKWFAPGGSAVVAEVYRRAPDTDWLRVASVNADGTGLITYEDRAVDPGNRYGYRLGILGQPGEQFFGETWVTVPTAPALSLEGLRPNPADRDLLVSFSLPTAVPAAVELVDLSGRILVRHDVDAKRGSHVVNLQDGRGVATGVYFVRLTQGGRSVTRKVSVVH